MDEPIIYLDILKEELSGEHTYLIVKEFFKEIQLCIEEVIEGILTDDLSKVRENLKTIQVISATMYAPFVAEFALLCESYAEQGREGCLKETFVLLFKQITLLKKECYEKL